MQGLIPRRRTVTCGPERSCRSSPGRARHPGRWTLRYRVYAVGTNNPLTPPGTDDVANPAAGATVNQQELLNANLLHSSTANWSASPVPTGSEAFTYKGTPQGTVTGTLMGVASCSKYNP